MSDRTTTFPSSPPETRYERQQEHDSDALGLLDHFMLIPQNSPLYRWPTTAELQEMKIFGLRPVNRIGDLKKGKFNGHCYDFEMISCGRGVNRWRLHWPNRPGYPKDKRQGALPLLPSDDWYTQQTGKPRPSGDGLPLFEAVRS